MADRYQAWTAGVMGGFVAKRLGLPRPEPLQRHRPGAAVPDGPVVLGGVGAAAGGGRLLKPLRTLLEGFPARIVDVDVVDAAVGAAADTAATADAPAALVFDATGAADSARLAEMYEFFHAYVRSLAPCGRALVVATPPDLAGSAREAVAQRAVEGFMRSLGKELRRGGTANLLQVAPGAEHAVESSLRFLLSARSAYVSGQVVRVGAAGSQSLDRSDAAPDRERPLAGRTAVVTGAARGIGAVIAETLARDGAFVLCVDVPAQGAALRTVAERTGGAALELDIAEAAAGDRLADRLREGDLAGADVFVHNAGITRDKTLGRMDRGQWDAVLAVNLTAVEDLTDRLLDPADPVLRPGGRIVCTSSISGIAGNVGQTNYAASKAGLIGLVEALAPVAADRLGGTVNAVAPGFIETQMTAAVPLLIREAGRRMNSLRQGGQPVDVAEAVAYLAAPGSFAVNGQVLRVCGQALPGA
jgi:3-oxoacyl-[acyl-carrier protein] reductase